MTHLRKLALNEEGFVFDPETGNSYTVNSTGKLILECLKDGLSEEEILDRIVAEFEVEREEAKRDLMDFLDQLRIYGLLGAKNA